MKAHKTEMVTEFQEIEDKKQTIFGAILEKELYTQSLEEKKSNLENRVNSLEHESSKYQRLFKEYNDTIEGVTNKIQKLQAQEKAITDNIDEYQH